MIAQHKNQRILVYLLGLAISFAFTECSAKENYQATGTEKGQSLTDKTPIKAKTNFGIDRGFRKLSEEDPFGTRNFVPIYRLLADPEKFNGREICFTGFWASKVGGCTGYKSLGIFATKEDALDFETLNSIGLELRGDPEIPNIANGTRVKVRGIYRVAGSENCIEGVVDAINISK